METIALAAPIMMMAAGGAQAAMGVVQGIRSSGAAKVERQQYEDERRTALLAADQEEIVRRQKLEQILATNEALRGSRGLDLNSGTADALRDRNIAEAEADIGTARLNRLGVANRALYGIQAAKERETGGLLSGAGAVVSGLGSAASGALKAYGKL